MAIGWSSGMATGAPALDEQHRRLVARLDALLSAVESGQDRASVEKTLRAAGDLAVRHFARDEDCLMRDRCPALHANGVARAEFVAILARFRSDYERHGSTGPVARDLEAALAAWVERYVPGENAAELPCVVQA